ncbi:MAG: GreA/GreB family elongation factor [Verrucomicrobiota bacterium]
MSRAFVKEDVDPPERSGRRRSSSGLPPGATNYITRRGAQRLEAKLARLRSAGAPPDQLAELREILNSVTVVDPPAAPDESVAFGAIVTVEDVDGRREIYRIVGVDELDFAPESVSWISPVGKTLLAASVGERVPLRDFKAPRVVEVKYPCADE